MRSLLFILLLFIAGQTFAQVPTLIWGKKIWAKDNIQLKEDIVNGISKDTTNATRRDNYIMTEKAVKDWADKKTFGLQYNFNFTKYLITKDGIVVDSVSIPATYLDSTMEKRGDTIGVRQNLLIHNDSFFVRNGVGDILFVGKVGSGSSWGLTGNAGTSAVIDYATNFIGTTDSVDLVFKVNNSELLRIKTNAAVEMSAARAYANFATAMSGAEAHGLGSTAMSGATATGIYSTAMSTGVASGDYSTAAGLGVIAPSFSETAIGTYNTTYTPVSTDTFDLTDRIFSVGIGTSIGRTIYPKNALTILKNGNVGIGTSTPTAKLHISSTDSNALKIEAPLSNTELSTDSSLVIGVDGMVKKAAKGQGTSIGTSIIGEYETGSSSSTFTLSNTPIIGTYALWKNGVRLPPPKWSLAGAVVTLTDTRLTTDEFLSDYKY